MKPPAAAVRALLNSLRPAASPPGGAFCRHLLLLRCCDCAALHTASLGFAAHACVRSQASGPCADWSHKPQHQRVLAKLLLMPSACVMLRSAVFGVQRWSGRSGQLQAQDRRVLKLQLRASTDGAGWRCQSYERKLDPAA